MNTSTISEHFRSLLGDDTRVVAAVFTTFNFEPDFFEEEIISLLLDRDLAFSSDKQVKSIQVRQALNEVQLPIEVFYDRNIFHGQADRSPAMEYLHHGVNQAPHAFHPKLSLVLVEQPPNATLQLLVGSGSANLTQAGWWENIECQHWEHIADGAVPPGFLDQLIADVAHLAGTRGPTPRNAPSALDDISEFLSSCSVPPDIEPIHYYGIADSLRAGPEVPAGFIEFLNGVAKTPLCDTGLSQLDIISPYFAEDASFDGHQQLRKATAVDHINLFLPMNDRGEALCTKTYYEEIQQADGVRWCTWSDDMRKALGLDGDAYRRTHAKIYHLHNNRDSWVFTGSVNFSYNAFNHNVEAGFFSRLGYPRSLLKPLEVEPAVFCDTKELRGDAIDAADGATCDIQLTFDWMTGVLTGCVEQGSPARITLLDAERNVLVKDEPVTAQTKQIDVDIERLGKLLQESGFVSVLVAHADSTVPVTAHRVLLQQINWTHKRLELARLSPQQILEIYAGMGFERRIQLVAKLREERLLQLGLGGETIAHTSYEETCRQFFSEYAELFQAFRNIRCRMRSAHKKGHDRQVDYYLTGAGVDSLPTLFDSLFEASSKLDEVTRYLALLCLLDIYRSAQFCDRHGAHEWRHRVQTRIAEIEQSGLLSLTPRNTGRADTFFAWFRSEFFKQYRQAGTETDDAAD